MLVRVQSGIPMNNTLEEIKQIKKDFYRDYSPALEAVGNNLALGIGKDAKTGEYTIEVRLTNNKLKSSLPETYQDAKVNILVIGRIVAF